MFGILNQEILDQQLGVAARLDAIGRAIAVVSRKLDLLAYEMGVELNEESTMTTKAMSDLQAAINMQNSVVASVTIMLTGLQQQLRTAVNSKDSAAIESIVNEIGNNTDALSKAVAANTSAARSAATPVQTPPNASAATVAVTRAAPAPVETKAPVSPLPGLASTEAASATHETVTPAAVKTGVTETGFASPSEPLIHTAIPPASETIAPKPFPGTSPATFANEKPKV